MTYLEEMIDRGSPDWLFLYPGHIDSDIGFLIQVIWEHVTERGEFHADERDMLIQKLREGLS